MTHLHPQRFKTAPFRKMIDINIGIFVPFQIFKDVKTKQDNYTMIITTLNFILNPNLTKRF